MRERKPARKGTQEENPPRVRRGRIDIVSGSKTSVAARVSPEMAGAIREAAELAGETLSEFVRAPVEERVREVLQAAGRPLPPLSKEPALAGA